MKILGGILLLSTGFLFGMIGIGFLSETIKIYIAIWSSSTGFVGEGAGFAILFTVSTIIFLLCSILLLYLGIKKLNPNTDNKNTILHSDKYNPTSSVEAKTDTIIKKVMVGVILAAGIYLVGFFTNFGRGIDAPPKNINDTSTNYRLEKATTNPPPNYPACMVDVDEKITKIRRDSNFLIISFLNTKNIYFTIPDGYEKGKHISVDDFVKKVKLGDVFIKKGNTYSFVTVNNKDTSIWAMSCPLDIYRPKLPLQEKK